MAKQYVIVDLEWIGDHNEQNSPTQLAAMRVDANWNPIQTIFTLIRPQNASFHKWEHVAYTGATAEEFLLGRSAYHAIEYFENWLQPDDVVCWWYSTGRDTYGMLARKILKKEPSHPNVILCDYLREFLKKTGKVKINPYSIAENRGIPVTLPEHYARNDVEAVQTVLKSLNFPQAMLESPAKPPKAKKKKSESEEPHYLYFYDTEAKLLHKCDSPCIDNPKRYQKYSTLEGCVKRKMKPCPICMKEEFEQGRRALCKDIISRTEYNYIYLPHSKVFHKYSCGQIRTALNILGCRDYDKAVATGRTPCKVCNPTPYDKQKQRKNVPASATKRNKRQATLHLSKNERHAMERLRQAQLDRFTDVLTDQNPRISQDDIITLTNTKFAFWAATGYQNFHLRHCTRLKGLANLKGFALYKHAIRAGYTPCKKCNPTPKYDAVVSMPILSKKRKDEKIGDLIQLCRENNFPFRQEDAFFYLETPVGKWKINVTIQPIQLFHINLAQPWKGIEHYHRQPRVFLSLIDTFFYVKKHDKEIMEKINSKKPEISENVHMSIEKEIEKIAEAIQATTGKILSDDEKLDLKVSVFVDPYRDVSNEELEEMLDDAESKQSDLEEAIDELESNMPSEDDPEYADAVKKLEELQAELEEIEDEIDNIEDEISEREDEDEDDDDE